MNIDELIAVLQVAGQQLGGDTQVVRYDDGSAVSLLSVVRINNTSLQTAVIEDLGNGVAAWTLNDDQPGPRVRCLLLE